MRREYITVYSTSGTTLRSRTWPKDIPELDKNLSWSKEEAEAIIKERLEIMEKDRKECEPKALTIFNKAKALRENFYKQLELIGANFDIDATASDDTGLEVFETITVTVKSEKFSHCYEYKL